MAQLISSSKRQQIDKSKNTMAIVAAVALFVVIFCLISGHDLKSKMSYQSKVITADTTSRNQLQDDVQASTTLTSSYEKFNDTKTNVLGSAVTGKTNDNTKIILDALPSQYDYPALATSIENILSNQGITIDSIGGQDESASIGTTNSASPAPVAMPFSFTIDGPYQNIQNVVSAFEKSITPFQFLTMDLSGNQSDVNLTITAQTYFQPPINFQITQENIK